MKVFLSGIAGTGMSSLAGLFTSKGFDVSGSDTNFYPPVDKILEKMNAQLFNPYAAENIHGDVDFCVIGNIISRGNPEAEAILNQRLDYYSMAEALYKYFIKGKKSIVAAGTHGKTTITSFISYMLQYAGLEPGYFIGGKPLDLDSNYAVGKGDHFVIEGDEYETSFFDRSSKFLKYHADYLILSALEYDHLDFFPDESIYLKAFQNLVNQVPANGLIIMNNDYPMNNEATAKAFTPVKRYGATSNVDYMIKDLQYNKPDISSAAYLTPGLSFTLQHRSKSMRLTTPMSGKYNAWNLSSGIILALHLGIPEQTICEAVESFNGVERRMNYIKRIENTVFLEDFAHHPTSIKEVLQSIKESNPGKKLVTLFEPRSWSLRRNFFQQRLADSFMDADEIFFKEVFEKEKIPEDQRLDVGKIKRQLQEKGKKVTLFDDFKVIETFLGELNYAEETIVVILSNGSFGGIPGLVKNY